MVVQGRVQRLSVLQIASGSALIGNAQGIRDGRRSPEVRSNLKQLTALMLALVEDEREEAQALSKRCRSRICFAKLPRRFHFSKTAAGVELSRGEKGAR